MKIAYCLFGTYSTGGLERVTSIKINWLASHGHEVYLITTGHSGQAPYFELDSRVKHIDLGLNYIEPGKYHRFRLYFVNKPKYRKHEQELNRIFHEIKPDIAVAAGWHEEEFLFRIKDGSKKIVEHHGTRYMDLEKFTLYYKTTPNPTWKDTLKYKAKMLFFKYMADRQARLAKRFDQLVCLTERDRQYYPEIKTATAISNPLTLRVESRSPLNQKIILAAGRLSGEKNFVDLVGIWSTIAKDYPDWKLRVIGEGNSEDDIRHVAQSNNLGNQFELLPFTSDMPTYYKEASICAVSSVFEGFGLVIIEAEAMGIPVVAYDCPCGPGDIIRDGEDGFLVPLYDRGLYAQRLRQLIESEDLRRTMGDKGVRNAERFSIDEVMHRWVDLFTELVERK